MLINDADVDRLQELSKLRVALQELANSCSPLMPMIGFANQQEALRFVKAYGEARAALGLK